jgi:hypothetical protein
MDFERMEMTSPAPGVVQINHAPSLCAGEYCCIHNPSDHHMRDWPTTFRSDRVEVIIRNNYVSHVFVLTERICEHGVGHPDPDSIAYALKIGGTDFAHAQGVHGCDRCCQPKVMMGKYELGTILEVRVSHPTFYSRIGYITGWDGIMGCDRYTLQWVNQQRIGDPENIGYATDSDILAVYRREEIQR